ncbi:hypothetical protein GGX14DRAFT_569275 [Mycena pura]|uniref:F-box domain-containing protein n=1 Tax=Mycena pura TaxID=153505 RepID=A0AAD6YBW8_9AGAR|nr:hypothetical protein GGX14DRAFT_569275 [Mycena pura]
MSDTSDTLVRTFGLLSLPNEILLVVFSHFEDPYPLYPLSTLCRRLHFLALPIYLTRACVYEALPDSTSCDITIGAEHTGTLAALQTSLFLGTVQSLCCTFSDSISQFEDLARFHRVCSILKSVESTTLQFSPASFNNHAEAMRTTYSFSIVQTLNTVLEKSCATLTVSASPTDSAAISSPRVSRRHLVRAPGGRRAQSTAIVTSSASLSPAALRQKKLSKFKMHSEVLFSPHLRAWTIDVLNSFPLVFLSIDIPTVPARVLDAILSLTEIATLRHFALSNCIIKPTRMHIFLSRHPGITCLHFEKLLVPSNQESLPRDHLPQLASLSAEAPQVAYLLHAMESTAALRAVRLLSHMTRLDLMFTDAALGPVASRLAPTTVSLTLVLRVPDDLPHIAIDPSLRFGEGTALQFVTKLELVFGYESTSIAPAKLADYIVKWSAPFPALRTVELVGLKERYEGVDLVQAVRTFSSTVETLVVNGRETDLTEPG